MYSSHGHHIPGTTVAGLQPLRVRCGGFERCEQCLREAAKVLVESEKDHHHILIGLSLKTAGTDQKIRGLLSNAIGWTFFGNDGETIVQISEEDAARCKIAAERCMVALREFKKIAPEEEEREDGNLVAHARRELELLGTEPDMIECLVKAVRGFASFGHSGGSASWAIPVLNDLLQYKNLTPITDNPDDWVKHEQRTAGDFWQNKRNSALFSDDGGKSYYDTGEHPKRVQFSEPYNSEESDEPAISGGDGGESSPDEHEPEKPSESSLEDASEAQEEGSHGI